MQLLAGAALAASTQHWRSHQRSTLVAMPLLLCAGKLWFDLNFLQIGVFHGSSTWRGRAHQAIARDGAVLQLRSVQH